MAKRSHIAEDAEGTLITDQEFVQLPAPTCDQDDLISDIGNAEEINRLSTSANTRNERRPQIDHLPNAIDQEGNPLFKPGDRIVVERFSQILDGNPWLDTRMLYVDTIDQSTGTVHCTDAVFSQHSAVSFRSPLQNFRIVPKGIVNPFTKDAQKRLKGDRKPVQVVTRTDGTNGTTTKRKGRPPGSKNRPKEVIKQEKLERRAKAKVKAEKRASKKRALKRK